MKKMFQYFCMILGCFMIAFFHASAKTTSNGVEIIDDIDYSGVRLTCSYKSNNIIIIDKGCATDECFGQVDDNDIGGLPFYDGTIKNLQKYEFMVDGIVDCPKYIYGKYGPDGLINPVTGFTNDVTDYVEDYDFAILDYENSVCEGSMCTESGLSYEEINFPRFYCNYKSVSSGKEIKVDRSEVGGDIVITYPDSTKKTIPKNNAGYLNEDCPDLYFNFSTKDYKIYLPTNLGDNNVTFPYSDDNYNFFCRNNPNVEYFCNNLSCNYQDRSPSDCKAWTKVYRSTTEDFCFDTGVKKALKFLGNLLLIAKIIIPLLLIIMGVIDFSKAVISSDADALKKNSITFAYRIVAGVAIFFLPTIINFIFNVILKNNPAPYKECTTCIFNPSNCDTSE